MEELTNEHLQEQRQTLENEKELNPEYLAVTENAILNIEKIMKERGVPIVLDDK